MAITLFDEEEYLPRKAWNLSSLLSYISCRVICVFHGKKLRKRKKGINLIFNGGNSIIWRILTKITGPGDKLGIVASAPRKTERVMVEVGEYLTLPIYFGTFENASK
ncbi:MAG: hypothetical protein NT142_07340 [Planctomycetota bacterium]|nr:hypothetical protein [Planctomycetota bacterium]